MAELKWPVIKCTGCGYDLREAMPQEKEKGNDEYGKLIWTDFCPKCGTGYQVGYRVLPKPTAEVLAEIEAAPVLSYVEDKVVKGKPSGIPPDVRGKLLAKEQEKIDPENLMGAEAESTAPPEEKPEPGAVKPPLKGQFFCTKCACNHYENKKIGKRHLKYREA